MRPHARDFRDYYSSTLGHLTQCSVNKRFLQVLGNVKGKRILAIGFGTPYLADFQSEAQCTLAVMSGYSGAVVWPSHAPSCVAIANEEELPFRDQSFDYVILVHALEWSEMPHVMMREIWRILGDNGAVAIVVPNRRSLWARFDATPFGCGRPYSCNQLKRLLEDAMFTPTWLGSGLLVPPGRRRFWFALGEMLEKICGRWLTRFSALTMATASKRMYGVTPVGSVKPKVSFVEVLSSRPTRQSSSHSCQSTPTSFSDGGQEKSDRRPS